MSTVPSSGPDARHRLSMAEVHKRIQAAALPNLSALLRETLDAVDDALFSMAEKAISNAEQARYFDGMREVRRRRGDIEHRFQERLLQGLVALADGRTRRIERTPAAPRGQAGLSLVENEELEQDLAVTAMQARAEGKLRRLLYAFNRRLGHLAGTEIDDETNPLAPAALATAFREAIDPLDCLLEVRLVLLRLFDRIVVDALEPIYQELNELLKAAGILPTIAAPAVPPASEDGDPGGRRRAPATQPPAASDLPPEPAAASQDARVPDAPGVQTRTFAAAAPPSPPGRAPAGAGARSHAPVDAAPAVPWGEGDDQDALDSPFADEVYRSIYTLLAARRTARHYAARSGVAAANDGGGQAPRLVVDVGDLLNALTLLQGEFVQAPAEPVAAEVLKHRLRDQVGKLGNDPAHTQFRARDEHAIDLVGMVFDYILQDPNLPAEIQVLLARLQVPYIKVALLDPRFFAMRSHPARRLLDELSQAGLGWSASSDPDRRLFQRIALVVDTVLRDFDDNLALFERLLANFRGFVAAERRRAEVAEQRAAEATRGRERLLGARRRAAREVLERVRGRDLPRVIHNILTRPWANFLVLTLLRQGEESEAWTDALRFADDLVWASEPKTTQAERERLMLMMPQMERMLRHGLTTVAYHDSDIQKLSAELVHQLESLADPDASDGAEVAVEVDEVYSPSGDPLVQPLDTSLEDGAGMRRDREPASPLADAWVRRARDLTIGTWVAFRQEDGPDERARLSWTSPVSGRLLFVNHKGLKVCDRSPEQLAAELEAGHATIIESSALVDRALADILERLRSQPVAR
jgi:hypothetical protein